MKKILLLVALVVGAASLRADDSGSGSHFFQAALTPDIAIQPKTAEIGGIALNVWGENPQHCFALGFVNGSTGESGGFTWAFFVNYADSYKGVAWSMVNISHTSFVGWQSGLANISKGKFSGVQTGWLNIGQEVHGLQWGVVNYAENLNGVQIGLANIATETPWFSEFPSKLAKGFPFFNWSF
jgi:hypothetical protein